MRAVLSAFSGDVQAFPGEDRSHLLRVFDRKPDPHFFARERREKYPVAFRAVDVEREPGRKRAGPPDPVFPVCHCGSLAGEMVDS